MSGRGGHGGGEGGRKKRVKPDEGSWDCTVCTFHNTADAFKCLMCDTRKGTSTRKPKLNSHLEEQVEQVVRQLSAHQTKKQRLSLNRDSPSPPSPPSPFDRDFDDRPSTSSSTATPGMISSIKGKGIGKNRKGGVGKKATVVAPIVEDDEDEDDDREEDDDDEEEEEGKEEKKKKTSITGKSAAGKMVKTSGANEKVEKSEKTEKKTSSSATVKKEKEPKVKGKNAEKKEKDTTSSVTTASATATSTAKKGKKSEKDETEPKRRLHRLKNVDRSTANSMAVTVNNITVIITDFKPKAPSEVLSHSEKKTKAES